MGIIRYGRTAQIGVYPGNQSGRYISYRSGGIKFPLDPDTQIAWNFARDKTLTDLVRGLTLDFARASTATYYDASKTLQIAAANEPRFDHDPVTGESLGLLIEEARTNNALHSNDFTNAVWLPVNMTVTPNVDDGEGGTTAFTLTASGGAGLLRQNFGSSLPLTAHNSGVWVRRRSGVGVIQLYTADAANTTLINPTADWQYFSVNDIATGAGDLIGFRVATDGDQIDVKRFMFEEGAFGTSYIPTTTTTVTRAAEDCNTTDVSWYTQGGPQTWYASVSRIGPGALGQVASLANGTSDEINIRDRGDTGDSGEAQIRAAGSNVGSSQVSGAWAINGKFAFGFDTDDLIIYGAGIAGSPDNNVTIPPGLSTLFLGRRSNGQNRWNGHYREFGYANVRKDNTFLQNLTAP